MEEPKPDLQKQKTVPKENRLLNILSIAAVAAAALVIIFCTYLFFRPNTALNPFPPPTVPAAVVLWTATPLPTLTPSMAEATGSALPTVELTPVLTPSATAQVVMQDPPPQETTVGVSAMAVTSSHTTATSDYTSVYPYQIDGEPAAISAALFDSSRATCDWMGAAGQVRDRQGSPVTGILVMLGGSLEQRVQSQTTITGTARNYGESGYEFSLSDHLIESENSVWIQLVDQSYIPLSAKVYFDTYPDCERNLVIINFKEVR